jgi:hypothetical protein
MLKLSKVIFRSGWMRRISAFLGAAAAAASVLIAIPTGASAATTDHFCWGTMSGDRHLGPGQFVMQSRNGSYRALFQSDYNFVVYHGSRPIWATGTNGAGGMLYFHQGARNSGMVSIIYGKKPWNNAVSFSAPTNDYSLVIQNDGNFVEYSGCVHTSYALWATNTRGR